MRQRCSERRKAAPGADDTDPGVDGVSNTVHPWVHPIRPARDRLEPPVIGSSNGARAQNGVLDGAATSPLHGSAPPPTAEPCSLP